MTLTRIALVAGIAVLGAFAVLIAVAGPGGLGAVVVAVLVLAGLIAGGNLLYGKNSHYARVQARLRGTQEDHDRAASGGDQARARASEWPGQEPPTDLAGGPGPLP